MLDRNGIERPKNRLNNFKWLVLTLIVVLGGCANLTPPSDNMGSGINLDYLFGVRRPAEQLSVSFIGDPEYAEYLEWKRWQDFQAYQEWKRLLDEDEISNNANTE